MRKMGIFVGRCQPLHLGHTKIIQKMIDECGVDNSLIVLGSPNAEISLRNPFTIDQRLEMIKKHFPTAIVTAIRDRETDAEWVDEFKTMLSFIYDWTEGPMQFTLYCEDDSPVALLLDFCEIKYTLNRKDFGISGTAVRNELLQPRGELSNMVPPSIFDDLQGLYDSQINAVIAKGLG